MKNWFLKSLLFTNATYAATPWRPEEFVTAAEGGGGDGHGGDAGGVAADDACHIVGRDIYGVSGGGATPLLRREFAPYGDTDPCFDVVEVLARLAVVGRRTLTPPDPSHPIAQRRLVPRWFQTLRLSREKPVSQNVRFKYTTCAATPRRTRACAGGS